MSKFTDDNGITWDIRSTTVRVDDKQTDASWFAAVDDSSEREYTGAGHVAMSDADTFGPPGTEPKITWPSGGNPILRGKGNDDDATATIRMFAQRNRGRTDIITLRVRSSPAQSESLLALLVIAAVVWLSDKRRR